MNDSDPLASRLEALETRSAHQDQTIEDLNTAITAQWKVIEAMSNRIGMLQDLVREIGDSRAGDGHPEPPPPHY